MVSVSEGRFSSGVPYLRLGQGPPLLMASGMTPEHANPTGARRRSSLSWIAPYAEHFTVHLVNRRAGLAPGTSISELAADYAVAIEKDIGEPVLLHGTSSGGTVGLQLAIDRPDLVRRMVLSAAACRLSTRAREVMEEVAQRIRAGEERRASALMFEQLVPPRMAHPARWMGWTMGGVFARHGLADMLVLIDAENAWDAEPMLSQVRAPTLVLGGSADAFYSTDLFRRTSQGVPQGTAVVFSGKSHAWVAGAKVPASMALGFLLG